MSTTTSKEPLSEDSSPSIAPVPRKSTAAPCTDPASEPEEMEVLPAEPRLPKKRGRKPGSGKPKPPVIEGMKRPKGRPRKNKPKEENTGPKRPRGRPRKYPPKDVNAPKRPRGRPRKTESTESSDQQHTQAKVKKAAGKKGRGRGRPRKITTDTVEPAGEKRAAKGRKRKTPSEPERETAEQPVVKRPRVKPPKKALAEAVAASELSGE